MSCRWGNESRTHEVFADGERGVSHEACLSALMISDTKRSHNVALGAQQPSLD